jgi:hypothetical protein
MRADLMALTPETVASLANLGLVKRALKELEQGKGPTLSESDDGIVRGTFDDGVVTELLPNRSLKDASCTCPASGMCRHRVAVALGYKHWALERNSAPPEPPAMLWSPGTIDDAHLHAGLERGALSDAVTARKRGVVVEVQRASLEQPVPTAKLPSCVVRFLVPHQVAFARCDCQVTQGCSHVALAVWAFRAADAIDAERAVLTVEVVDAAASAAPSASNEALDAMVALVHELAMGGVTSAREALAQRFTLVGEALSRKGLVWPATGLEDLAWMLDRYRARSSRYHPAAAHALATELVARARVTSQRSELPTRYVLGQGEAMETRLDHLRLISLGVSIESDGRERVAEIFLADPDTGMVSVLQKSWTFPEGDPIPEGPELARRRVASTASLGSLGAGQLVSRVARRRAKGTLTLGPSAVAQTSVMPQTGDFASLPKPLRVDGLDEIETLMRSRPPQMLRPRLLGDSLHAVAVGGVEMCAFDAAAQRLHAVARDPEGRLLRITSPFSGAAPRALDVLALALSGAMGPVRFIAGALGHDGGAFVLTPTMVVADRVIVPVLEAPDGTPKLASAVVHEPPPDRLEAARSLLEEAFHLGLMSVSSSYEQRLERAARDLEAVGAAGLSERLQRFRQALRSMRAGSDAELTARFFDASIRLALAIESRASLGPMTALEPPLATDSAAL